MSKNDSKLVTKVSSLIEGQVPDFVQSDHPQFVKFLKDYYQFLEAGRLTLEVTVNYIAQETTTSNYIIDETTGERIVTEIGEGTTGQFVEGETITGGTSNATATVLVDDSRNSYLYVTSQQKFETGETITGGTSGSTAKITEYRANPVQNIQQLLEYANVDNTIFDFLDEFRYSFMNAVPNTLASGVSKRNLIKSIRDLYSAKGTSEANKIFLRLLLGEQPEIFYPNVNMMRVSDGSFGQTTVLRVTPQTGVTGDEIVNQLITGQTSGAIATVESAAGLLQGTDSITELRIAGVIGTFTDGEKITANSTERDLTVEFTVGSVFASTSVVNDGILHSENEVVDVEGIGNGFAEASVNEIGTGGVSGIEVDDAGTLYEVGDTLTFTASSSDTDISSASGFVSMVGGGIQLESGTLDDSSITTDRLILESRTQTHLEPFTIQLEEVVTETFKGDGTTKVFTLSTINTSTDADIKLFVDNDLQQTTDSIGNTIFTLSGATLTFTTAPSNGAKIFVQAGNNDQLLLDGTDSSSTNAGHQILTEDGLDFEQEDTHTTIIDGETNDRIVLEFDTFENLGVSSESGSIQRAHISESGVGYTSLPTVSISTTTGTGAKLLAVTDDIGAVKSIKIEDQGFNFKSTNPPDLTLRAHFVLKDVTGTFANANTLTTHTGTVKGFNSSTNVLDTTFENVVRVTQEQDGTFQETLELEDGTFDSSNLDARISLEDIQDFDDGEDIILDGTAIVTPPALFERKTVKVIRNSTDTANIYQIDGVAQPFLTLKEGDTYYFDLSDSSLYNADASNRHILRFSTTSDGTHGGGVEYTDGVTKSESYIAAGTTGAYIQIAIAVGAPSPLYYYCTNHSGMGGEIRIIERVDIIQDEGGNVLLDATDVSISALLLEDGFEVRQEALMPTRSSHIRLDQSASDGTDQNANIILESGVDSSGTSVILSESDDKVELEGIDNKGDRFLLEVTTLSDFSGQTSSTNKAAQRDNENEKLLLDRYQENDITSLLLFDGFDSDGTGAGSFVGTEEQGINLVLEGTDSDNTDANENFLLDDKTGDGDITLNGSDSDSTDAGDNIINESGIDFSNKNVTITDSSGASGTIVKADIGTATSAVDTTSLNVGEYSGVTSLLGEDLIRIQDSYYYQDYSYEVQIGQAFATYSNELRKAIHPAGFQPFGKVSIATSVSVALRNAGSGVSDYDGDTTTFSPILASTFETLFDQLIQSRSDAPKYKIGAVEEKIIYESGHTNNDKLVLDASSSSTGTTIPAGTSIVLESGSQPDGYDYDVAYLILDGHQDPTTGNFIQADVGGQIDLESGSFEDEYDNILLEDGNNILLEDDFFLKGDFVLYETETRRDNETGNGRMMSEDSLSLSNKGESVVVKQITTKLVSKPTPRVTRNMLMYLAETPFGRTGGISALQLENESISAFKSDVILLDGEIPLNEINPPITLESPVSRIVLNGTDSDGTNAGDAILTEEGDVIINETAEVDTGVKDRLLLERGGIVLAESDNHAFPVGFSVNIGERLLLEDDHDEQTIPISDISNISFNEILRENKLI